MSQEQHKLNSMRLAKVEGLCGVKADFESVEFFGLAEIFCCERKCRSEI